MLGLILLTSLSFDERNKAEEIWNTYSKLMVHTAKKQLNGLDMAVVEDCVSQSMMKILKNLNSIGDVFCDETRSYIVIIVRNTAKDILRSRQIHPYDNDDNEVLENIIDEKSDVSEKVATTEGYNILVQFISELPGKYRDVLYLSLVEGHSHHEISDLLGISESASKMRLNRGKLELKNKLRDGGYER